MSQHPSKIKFRFQYVNQSGKVVGWRSVGGFLTEETIQLKGEALDYRAILHSTCRDRRLILTVDPQKVSNAEIAKHLISRKVLVLEITRAKARDLELFINRISSHYLAETHREELDCKGKRGEFRSVSCPHCEATVDLSLLNKTPYVYCRFCETIFQQRTDLQTLGRTYRLCDECGWFDRIQGYTEFYFYFLLIVYGFSWKRRHLCDNCVDPIFRKVLLTNLIFILGIFPALWMKIKSLIGRDKDLKNLAKANALGKKGDFDQADIIYAELQQHYPKHPGILLSQSLSHLHGQNGHRTWSLLEQAVQSCSNYAPAVRVMNRLQDKASKASLN